MLNELIKLTIQWAHDRNLIEGSNPISQLSKTLEETAETLQALYCCDQDGIKDGYGDILVTLIIGIEQSGLTVSECLAAAYEEIKDRKGTMVNGVFVKELT